MTNVIYWQQQQTHFRKTNISDPPPLLVCVRIQAGGFPAVTGKLEIKGQAGVRFHEPTAFSGIYHNNSCLRVRSVSVHIFTLICFLCCFSSLLHSKCYHASWIFELIQVMCMLVRRDASGTMFQDESLGCLTFYLGYLCVGLSAFVSLMVWIHHEIQV